MIFFFSGKGGGVKISIFLSDQLLVIISHLLRSSIVTGTSGPLSPSCHHSMTPPPRQGTAVYIFYVTTYFLYYYIYSLFRFIVIIGTLSVKCLQSRKKMGYDRNKTFDFFMCLQNLSNSTEVFLLRYFLHLLSPLANFSALGTTAPCL